jgi:predicted heme/steroid binding protein
MMTQNLLLLLVGCWSLVLVTGQQDRASSSPSSPPSSSSPLRDFTQTQFERFNGVDEPQRYVALDNQVYDLNGTMDLHEFSGKFISIIGDENSLAKIQSLPLVGKISTPAHSLILTKDELSTFTGLTVPALSNRIHPQIFVSVRGSIFDVSYGGFHLYGPGGPYHVFAGKDASRSLAIMSMESHDLESSDLSDLTEEQRVALSKWYTTFDKKYPLVGALKLSSSI